MRRFGGLVGVQHAELGAYVDDAGRLLSLSWWARVGWMRSANRTQRHFLLAASPCIAACTSPAAVRSKSCCCRLTPGAIHPSCFLCSNEQCLYITPLPAEARLVLTSPLVLSSILCSNEQYLYIAMAGQHQIWRMDTATGVLGESQ